MSIYYANRAFAHIKMENYGLALQDALESIRLNKDYAKAHYRAGSVYLVLSKKKDAYDSFLKVFVGWLVGIRTVWKEGYRSAQQNEGSQGWSRLGEETAETQDFRGLWQTPQSSSYQLAWYSGSGRLFWPQAGGKRSCYSTMVTIGWF